MQGYCADKQESVEDTRLPLPAAPTKKSKLNLG
jgi:hypothetical protein